MERSLCFLANSNYELGRGNKAGGWEPKPIPSLEHVRIIQIASGGYHSLALTGKQLENFFMEISLCLFFSDSDGCLCYIV